MFANSKFRLPYSAVAAYNKKPALPQWCPLQTNLEKADQIIKDIENDPEWQKRMRNYFGMVKLIDDKVGKLLSVLKKLDDLEKNTIVVFTRCVFWDRKHPYISINLILCLIAIYCL